MQSMANINQVNPTYSRCSSVKLLSLVQLFANPWTVAYQAILSIHHQLSELLKFMSIE